MRRRKPKKSPLIFILTVLCLLLMSGFALSAYINDPGMFTGEDKDNTPTEDNTAEVVTNKLKDNYYTFLLVGVDQEKANTDTIMVASVDTNAKTINLVSIPRDSMVDVERFTKKINAAYGNGGVEQLKQELQTIIGFVPQNYMIVDLQALKKMVDTVGGIEFDVPEKMDYDDPKQNLHIHLSQGQQHIDGSEALQLVRYRGYANRDIGRMETQQKFIKALVDKTLSFSSATKVMQYIEIFQTEIDTDLTLREMQWLARKVLQMDTASGFTVQTLPDSGNGLYKGVSYLYLDQDNVLSMVNEKINPYTQPITAEDVRIIKLED
ncbi:LCP family protein [Dehalobacter sp. DCM]|uniref:LCP family protein n=1 Tax=Dehalobacter sp. DCM TaxID=2907827 RepID=UPI003081585A|nr:LCP family protein [Dehalobacter sp. DCM]